ncbi:uroporphyrinogen-III C-methyltransferase [Salsuginibacillus halophilus]|uniref:Uroporphyrinogen-III C-methyltransferase n=1 Tax=Salsuginibacillus halophilus TaxID=517424 RepID=A0A2P8H9Q4_9BACI|nr:uroporphyrinogen-III C-methyltransferase [Salsuginibacillus halophilus]PSL42955.1 uroporphyrinogen-III C-methyltransferase [Salsuginibacillus halophilus]
MTQVYIVGAGPGDAELITVKGLKAIQTADVILYDRLVNPALLEEAPPHAQLIYAGKQPNRHAMPQEEINAQLCAHARRGKVVTRLKGGDPFIFGRGGEEAAALASANISFEIVPGITSGAAVPAYAGIPVTHRDYSSSVTFVAGVSKTNDESYWQHIIGSMDTLCIYMGIQKLEDICDRLLRHGRTPETPVAVIEWGTTGEQRTITGTVTDIAVKAADAAQPGMIVVGEVVKLREELQWFTEHQAETVEAAAH